MSSFAVPRDDVSSPRHPDSGSQSPVPPPYSPITPELPTASLATASTQHSSRPPPPRARVQHPPPVPISESTNSDAIALRAALSVLQLQRLRAVQDLQTLERQKLAATADPEAFSRALTEGKIATSKDERVLADFVSSQDVEGNHDSPQPESKTDEVDRKGFHSEFGTIPSAQNIARCPPITWEKYHVVGEVLDKLHNEQQAATPEVTAAYSPWKDKLPNSTKTKERCKTDGVREVSACSKELG